MSDSPIVWSPKKLAKEFKIAPHVMTRILTRLGAIKYTNSTYTFELDSEGTNEKDKRD